MLMISDWTMPESLRKILVLAVVSSIIIVIIVIKIITKNELW